MEEVKSEATAIAESAQEDLQARLTEMETLLEKQEEEVVVEEEKDEEIDRSS